MSLYVTLSNGIRLGFMQMMTIDRLMGAERDQCHWHLNECRCCVTVHTPHGAYVVGEDGGYDGPFHAPEEEHAQDAAADL